MCVAESDGHISIEMWHILLKFGGQVRFGEQFASLSLRFSQVVLELDRAYLRNWSILCDPSKSKRGCLSSFERVVAGISGLVEQLCCEV